MENRNKKYHFYGDEFLDDAIKLVKGYELISFQLFQEKLHIGYARAVKIMHQLNALGLVTLESITDLRFWKVIKLPKRLVEDKPEQIDNSA